MTGKTKQERLRTLREQGLELLRAGKHEPALAAFAMLEKLEPREPDWPRRASDCHRELGDRPGEIEALGRAMEAYASAGVLTKAIAMCRMILKLDPAHTRTQARLVELQAGGAAPVVAPRARHAPRTPPRATPALPVDDEHDRPAPGPDPTSLPTALPAGGERPRPRLDQILRQRRAARTRSGGANGETPARKSVPSPSPSATSIEPTLASSTKPRLVASLEPPVLEPLEPDSAETLPPSIAEDESPASDTATTLPPSAARSTPPRPFVTEPRPSPDSPVTVFLSPASGHASFPSGEVLRGPSGSPSGMFRLVLDEPVPPTPLGDAQKTAQRALPTTPLFSELGPRSLEQLIAGAELVQVAAGEAVYRRNDASDALYVIVGGSVAVLGGGDDRVELGRLGENEFFGESALISNELRLNGVEALEPTELLRIDRGLIREIIADEPRALRVVLRFVRDRLLDAHLLTNPLFTILSKAERRALAARFDFLQVDRGSYLVEQGSRSPGLFVLLCGTAEVTRHEGDSTHLLAVLREGAVFGEMSLLDGAPAMAEVRSVSRGFALMLPESEFRSAADAHPELVDFLMLLAASRRERNRALLGALTPARSVAPESRSTLPPSGLASPTIRP